MMFKKIMRATPHTPSRRIVRGAFHAMRLAACAGIVAGMILALDSTNAPAQELEPAQNNILIPHDLGTQAPLRETPAKPSISLDDIPEILLAEMQFIERRCNGNPFYARLHDCRCIAVRFLDERMNSDPAILRDTIFNRVKTDCVNTDNIAGNIYTSCMETMPVHRPDDYASFCECSANEISRRYTARPAPNMSHFSRIKRDGYMACGLGSTPVYRPLPLN